MGAVYLARDTQLDREVALKIPFISPEDGPKPLERFYREARAAAPLHHPNLCPVHDVGEIVEWISAVMTLLPGDLILTGTPEGVGPIEDGDTVSVTVEGIGTLTNPVVRKGKS